MRILVGDVSDLDGVRVLIGEATLTLGEPPFLGAMGLRGGGETRGRDGDCEPPRRPTGDRGLDGEQHGRERSGEAAI